RVAARRERRAPAGRAELVAAEDERRRRAELESLVARAAQLRRDVEVRAASLDERRAALSARLTELEADIASLPDAEVAARDRLARAEQSRDDARTRRGE